MSRFLRRFAIPVAVVAAVTFAAVASTGSETVDDAGADLPPAPDVRFETFEGQTVALSDFQGTPVVLNFWASWCPACVAEMPDFEQVHKALGGEVTFIGLDTQDISREAALALAAETGVTYQLADDPDGAIYAEFGGLAMPTTVFIDAQGRIADVHAGALFAEDLSELIDSLLLDR